MPVLAVTGLYAVLFAICVRIFAPREGYYSTVTVFGIACFVYYLAIPVEMALTGDPKLPLLSTVLPPEAQLTIAVLGTLAFVSFVVGYRLSGFCPIEKGSAAPLPAEGQGERTWIPPSLAVMGTASVILALAFFGGGIRSLSTYEGMYTAFYLNPAFSLLCDFVVLSLALAAALGLGNARPKLALAALFVVAIFAWGVYTSDKNPLLLACLAAAAYFQGRRSARPWIAVALLLGAALSLAAAQAFSVFRAGEIPDLATMGFSMRKVDPAGPMVSMSEALATHEAPAWGATYLQNLYLWIPKYLWPDRPLDLAEAFAQQRMTNWAPGHGLGYLLLTESYRNFGWLGSVVQYFAIGWLWGMFWKWATRFFATRGQGYPAALYYVIGFYLLVLMHRGPTTSLVKSLIQIMVPLALLHIAFDRPALSRGLPGSAIGGKPGPAGAGGNT